jgi:putative transposase
MKRLQAYKFELRPNGEQERQMSRFAGSCRFVYNKALAMQKARYEAGEKRLGYAGLCKELTQWKQESETLWLRETHSQALQQRLKDLERAYKNFFEGRSAFPTFKKRGQHDAFRFPQGVTLDQGNSRIKLPKLGWIRYRKSREVLGVIKNITVSLESGRWYASIQTEREIAEPTHPETSMVGVDVGVANFATLSDGSSIEPINSFKRLEKRLAREQRKLSRKVKFSSNWKKQKSRISRLHRKIGNARNDFLHKVSSTLSKNHAMIVIEDLNVKGMSRSAKGTAEDPGKNVRAKSGLNKSILDQGWGNFRRMLEYKSLWLGGEVLAVNPAYTSRTCSACGYESVDNRKTQAKFHCVSCGHEAHADHNAALNILAAGHAVLACGAVALASVMKQEPAEATQGNRALSAVGIPVP